MCKIDYDMIKDDMTILWVDGREHFWYQKAWSILKECGLTSYETDAECYDIYIRAITLSMLYSEFCKLAFDEFDYYACYDERFENEMNDIMLGQLYSKLEDAELTFDKNYILCRLADSKRKEVFSALRSKMNEFDMYLGMYYTSVTPYGISFSSYDEYWDILLTQASDLTDDIISADGLTFEEQQAYDWLLDGAYQLETVHNSDC